MSEPKRNKLKIPESSSSQTEVEEPVIVEKLSRNVGAKKAVSEKTVRPPKPSAPAKPRVSLKERFSKFLTFYNNERTQKVLGLLLILTGVYLCIAFTSKKSASKYSDSLY